MEKFNVLIQAYQHLKNTQRNVMLYIYDNSAHNAPKPLLSLTVRRLTNNIEKYNKFAIYTWPFATYKIPFIKHTYLKNRVVTFTLHLSKITYSANRLSRLP